MKENAIPKWQRELSLFLGIKSGIILEGNIYDEYPIFDYEDGLPVYSGTDNMEETIHRLINKEQTNLYFFDPIVGFYCVEDSIESQRNKMNGILSEYTCTESYKDHGTVLCLMPSNKEKSNRSDNNGKYVWMSEIVRNSMLGNSLDSEVKNSVFVLNFASRLDSCNISVAESNTMFLNLLAAVTAFQVPQGNCNSLVLIVDKYNDIPAWVYLNNPNIKTISVSVPDRNTRRLYLNNLYGDLETYQVLGDEDYDSGTRFVAETDGLRLKEISQVLQLAYRKNIPPANIRLALRLYRYGVLDNPWEKLEKNIVSDIEKNLEKRVKGQSGALKKVKTVVTRAVQGLSGLQHSSASQKPKGILFFAGPTGVGKTETAKALAESIFGDENSCIRFDMSEYRMDESDQKLFGAPPGYVGYEGGGQLTNAIKEKPFCILLFDEIEKAAPSILDKFLQILEDGRMTDNQGNTVYFGETIIIFTSNIGLTKEVYDPANPFKKPHREPTITIDNPIVEDTQEFQNKVYKLLTEGVKNYFYENGRPELLNRLGDDNIVVFQFINIKDAETICDYKLGEICESIKKEKKITLDTVEVKDMLRKKAVLEREQGGRGIGNMLEREFLNPLSDYISKMTELPEVLKCHEVNDKVIFKKEV